jgi:tetratricopeptide (TPR) repeat protein
MELFQLIRMPKFLAFLFLLVSLPAPITNAQSSPSDLDKLYESALSLEGANLDSTYSIANFILEQSIKQQYKRGEIKSKLLATYYFWNKNQLDTAKLLLTDCIDYFNQQTNERNTLDYGRTLYYFGLVSHRAQELRLAKKYGLEALKVFTAQKNQKYVVNSLTFIGSVELSLSNYSEALKYFTRAYKVKIEEGEPNENCIQELSNISNVYQKMGVFDDALTYAHKSFSIAKQANMVNEQINLLNTLGSIHSSAGNLDSAYFYFKQCKETAIANNKLRIALVADYNVANTYSNNGRYLESNEIMKTLLDGTTQATPSILEMIKTLKAKNYLRLKKYDSAILIASPLLKEALKKGSRQAAINISEILWQAYEKKGVHDSSFFYLLEHTSLKDSIYNLDNQRKLSTLYAEMETLEKQAEIDALEKDKTLQKTKNQNLQIIMVAGGLTITLLIMSLVLGYKNREKKQQLLNIELQTELDKNKKTLHQQALRIIYINNGLTEIESSLKKIKISGEEKQQDVQQILNTIHLNKSLEKEWENFNEYFGNVHGAFISELNTLYPELTTAERRLASLIKMNLTNREIASIINIEQSSVKMAKYRLKKKFQIPDDQDIHTFLHNLGQETEPIQQN